jgi:hypothetical protein
MSQKNRRSNLVLLAVCIVFGGTQAVHAQSSVDRALNKCATIAEDSARLSCYDALAEVLVADSAGAAEESIVGDDASERATDTSGAMESAAATAVAGSAAVVGLTDDVGKERIESPNSEDLPVISGTVVECRKSAQSGQYYFTFDNGQVWKQSNYRSASFRNCDFEVEITKNAFGYEMFIPSKDRTLRIARVK